MFSLNNFKVLTNNPQNFLQLKDELFNSEIYKFKSDNSKPIVVDCGANIGMSVLYFKHIYPDAEIHAFEPDKQNFELLNENVRINNLTDVYLYEKAVWIQNTMLNFSMNADLSSKHSETETSSKAKAIDLSEFLKQHKVDFLKIDIEGAENTLIEHISENLKNIKFVFVEYHSEVNKEQKLSNILKVLTDSGFRYHIHDVFSDKYKLNKKPFTDRNTSSGFDMQLNIFGFRN